MANLTISHRIRFGEFEADLVAGELRKQGSPEKILLQDQPLQTLRALVARPGEMVSREELIQLLWNGNTNVDFDPSLNKTVNRLRESLGDSAESPRYIETLSRRGYRFIGKIEVLATPSGSTNPPRAWRKMAVWAVAGTACVLATVFGYQKIRPRMDPNRPATAPAPFTAYPGMELWPTFSPDGSQIAFVWNGDPGSGTKGYDLYVKVIGSENLLRLTNYPSETLYPAWSPDGTQIAFNRISGADTGLYVVPALGGPERKLRSILRRPGSIRTHFGSTAPVSWSPDGKSIAFVNSLPPDDNLRISLLSVETLESKQISHPAECINAFYPAFSHSGELLAYVCLLNPADMEFGIYTVPSRGGPAVLVTRFKTGLGRPLGIAWKADDKKLILSRPRFAYDMELDEVTLSDGSLRILSFGQDACEPAVSAKGDKLAFVLASFNHVGIWRKDLSHPEAAPVKLLTSTRSQQVPQYSPDGRHIAFTSNRGGPWEIWMSDADGTHLVQLSDANSSDAVYARWSPDSQKVAFDSRHSGHAEVYVVDISERKPHRIVTNLPYISTPSWSHDGKWLYVQSTAAHADFERIFRCPAAGGDAVPLSAKPSYFPWESYDGKTLYFADPLEKSSIHMMFLQPAGPESVLRGMPVVLDISEWTVVPRGIYFAPADARKSLCYFDFATRQVRRVFEVDHPFQDSLSVSPDERWILYTQAEPDNADIMLVENFR